MKVELCDLCNEVITYDDKILKVKAKRRFFYVDYEYRIPKSMYQGITVCPYCIKAIVEKSKELRTDSEVE